MGGDNKVRRLMCKATFALHKGGTKFYQVYLVKRFNDDDVVTRQVVVFHWGKVSANSEMTPSLCGQTTCKFFSGRYFAGETVNNKIREKAKHGYEFEDTNVEFELEDVTDTNAINELIDLFGRKVGNDIATFLKLNMNPEPNLEPGAGTSVLDEPVRAVTIEGWGSW